MNKENSDSKKLNDSLSEKKEKEKEKKSTFRIYLETLRECCSNSTSHGIPNIARTESWVIRIFWLILLIGAAVASVYCIFFFTKNYLKIIYY